MRTPRTLILLSLAATGFAACQGDPGERFQVVGRLSYGDPSGCSGAVWSQNVSWRDCHAFKRHFEPRNGSAIRSDEVRADALRPLPVTLELSHYRKDAAGNLLELCDRATIQTDLDGAFNTSLARCPVEGEPSVVTARAVLQYGFTQASGGKTGTVRAVWREDQADELFDGTSGEVRSRFSFGVEREENGSNVTHRYALPEVGFTAELDGGWNDEELNLGNRVFLSDANDDSFNYMRQVLSAWGSMIELHDRIRRAYNDSDAYYNGMFVTEAASGWTNAYTIWFDNTWAYGWRGGIALYRPDRDALEEAGGVTGGIAYVLSSVGTLAHEIGHSAHGAFAGQSFTADYGFANPLRRANGENYDSGHGVGQYQEMGTSMTEGLASSMGQFLVNGCEGFVPRYRPLGGASPFSTNMWSGNTGCDATDGCSSHHFRYHMWKRGVEEGSKDWDERLMGLQALTFTATVYGQGRVVSNDEGRFSEFGCDLLDSDRNVDHARGRFEGLMYMPDFTFLVAEVLDGRLSATLPSARYGADGAGDEVQLTLPQLLDGMARFCPDCGTLPWQFGEDYNRRRVSALQGELSPQALGRFLVSEGRITDAQLRNLLASNFMEDGF
jgi:hypothetical protein